MILKHYVLKEKPYSLLPNPRFFYLSEQYIETKSKLLYFLKDRTASLYLFGPIGSGKTSLLRLIAGEIDGDKATLAKYIIASNTKTANQLLRRICEAFEVKTERSYDGSLKNFEKFLIAQAEENQFPLLLVDEAQNLSLDQLKLIHYLLNYVSNERVLLMVVLVGQPELAQKVARFPSLKSRLISATVSDMTRGDMEAMLQFRWDVASGNSKTKHPFTEKATKMIYGATVGNPREVIKLCESSLIQGFLKKTKSITPTLVKKALKDI